MAMLDKEANRILVEGETEKAKEIRKLLKMQEQDYVNFANTISNIATNSLMGFWDAMERGENISDAIGQMFQNLTKQIAEAVIQASIFAAILSLISGGAANGGVSFFTAFKSVLGLANGGIATGPTLAMIGEGSESEAVLPLSKLGNIMQGSFNAGAMNGSATANNGQFVLKGNDLVLALQRSNSSLNLRRGGI
jgi:ABC-type dipeptide/oligopeptide/nickel transport system permease component